MPLNGYRLENVTVLVVDDNQHMRSLVRAIVEALGVRNVFEAVDGKSAMARLRVEEIDIVIADWNMEPMDGLQLCRKIRNNIDGIDRFTPFIMLTGHTEMKRVVEARDAGVTEFMAKPVSARSLYSRIVSIVENPREFIRTKSYFGPDRRRRAMPFDGPDRRSDADDVEID